ncbi:MAG: hypothetical protein SGCHY_004605 [Lobulomycetales sp.]
MPEIPFVLPETLAAKYTFTRELGHGAYGVVVAARVKNPAVPETRRDVAIKKITKVFSKAILSKRTLREIKILRFFNGHENITSLLDMDIGSLSDFDEVFIVQDLMEADLHQIIKSEQQLSDSHYQYFIYQVLRGLKYIHSANVIHRDLKPGNLLVNADCELKICDFGLARGLSEAPSTDSSPAGLMTEYVATRWYRAPEIMLSYRSYTKAIDMWSVGCIFAELLSGKPLFKGRDYVDQLNQILGILGTPEDEVLSRIASERAENYIRNLPHLPAVPLAKIFTHATPAAIDLLEKLLKFDPEQRITVEEALSHPYLQAYHESDDEPVAPEMFDFSFEHVCETNELRPLIVQEVLSFQLKQM